MSVLLDGLGDGAGSVEPQFVATSWSCIDVTNIFAGAGGVLIADVTGYDVGERTCSDMPSASRSHVLRSPAASHKRACNELVAIFDGCVLCRAVECSRAAAVDVLRADEVCHSQIVVLEDVKSARRRGPFNLLSAGWRNTATETCYADRRRRTYAGCNGSALCRQVDYGAWS